VYFHKIFSHIAATGAYDVSVLSHMYTGAPRDEDIDGLHVIRRGGRATFNYTAAAWLIRHARTFDCIVEDINKVPFFTPLYVRTPRLHMVMHFFGRTIFSEINPLMASYIYGMERCMPLVYARERFVGISESTRSDIYRLCGSKAGVSVVEPGIDTAFFHPVAGKAARPAMVYVGRLKKYKNVQFVLRCLPRLRERIATLRFDIAGGGDYEKELRRLVDEMKLNDCVHFHGIVSEEHKRRMLSEAWINVLPSVKEGWGITNIEANCCGTVALASGVHGLRDSVQHGETGYLFAYNDEDDFMARALELLQDTGGIRTRMERQARTFGTRYSWEAMAYKMQRVIDHTLGRA
jgi:glycosyltransferase involved in cell wall biosynthesis